MSLKCLRVQAYIFKLLVLFDKLCTDIQLMMTSISKAGNSHTERLEHDMVLLFCLT